MKLQRGQLGGSIKKARNNKNLTQEELAELVGVTTEHIQQVESERRNPSSDLLLTIADTLDMSLDALLANNDDYAQELKKKINLGLNHCSTRDMEIAYTTIEAMREQEDETEDEDDGAVEGEDKDLTGDEDKDGEISS